METKTKISSTIRKIPDDLWNEIKLLFPSEKPNNNTIGRALIPFGKVLNGILHVLRTRCQWKMLAKRKNIVLTLLAIADGAKKLLEDLFQTL
jgi:Putative transposase of IS4/5 family (DUF4096)